MTGVKNQRKNQFKNKMYDRKKVGRTAVEEEAPSLSVRRLSGASFVKFKPLFSYDSRFLFVIAEKEIKVLNTKSGICVRTLIGHETRVISVQTNPGNRLQILSCSTDGVVIRWNYEEGTRLYSLPIRLNNVAAKVKCFFAPSRKWYVVPETRNNAYCLLELLPGGKGRQTFEVTNTIKDVTPAQNAIAFGMEGNLIGCVNKYLLTVLYCPDEILKRHKNQWEMTCVACHPKDCVVATGDVNGRIFVWLNILSKQPAHSIYHWHFYPLADLAFTAEGSFLFSGGEECTLVKWHLRSNDKQYVPRMGLPLCYVTTSPDNSYVATSHVDNAIQLVSPQHYIVQVFQGLTKNSETFPVGLLYDPRSRSLVLNGRPGHLQFYQPHQDKQLYNLDIIGQNYITGPRNWNVQNTEVEKAAIGRDGKWIATVEHRDDGETSVEIRLKFWRFDEKTQEFCLNTNILLPHNKRINEVKFKPPPEENVDDDVPMLITTSDDEKFKFWALRRNESQANKGVVEESWMCHSLGYYHSRPAGSADFSEDGSLVGVAFGHALTLWTTEVTAMKSALVYQHEKNSSVRGIAFGRGLCCHLVVSQTRISLTVWNVLSLTVSWNVQTCVSHLAVDPFSDVMAAFTFDKDLFVFRPSDPAPLLILPLVTNSKILAASFVPALSDGETSSSLPWPSGSRLIFLTSKRELLTITDQLEEKEPESISVTPNISKTPFGLVMARYQKTSAPEVETTAHHPTRGLLGIKALNDILEVPSHVLPPVSNICRSFVTSLLVDEKKYKVDDDLEEKVPDEEVRVEDVRNADELAVDLRGLRLETYDWLSERVQN